MTTTEVQDYVPEEEWPPVSTMLDGFGDQTLPASPALAGTKIALEAADGTTIEYSFRTASQLTWTEGTASGTADYKAIEARPGIFIIDFVRGQGPEAAPKAVPKAATAAPKAAARIPTPKTSPLFSTDPQMQ